MGNWCSTAIGFQLRKIRSGDGQWWWLPNNSNVLNATVLYTGKQVRGLTFILCVCVTRTSLVAETIKRLPAMRETWVRSRGREDPLEKEMATHSSILAWRIPWMEEPGGWQSMGLQRVRHEQATSLSLYQNLKKKIGCQYFNHEEKKKSLW